MLIRSRFFEKLHFPQVDLRILFLLLFFFKSRVRASSEVQTQTNCYMYAILLPVIRVTRWSNCGQCMCGDWWISILGLCQFLCVCSLSILDVVLIKGNEKSNRKRNGRKRDANTIERSRQEKRTGKFCS